MTDDDRGQGAARAALDYIIEMISCLDLAQHGEDATWEGEPIDEDGMREIIEQDALSVEVRNTDWRTPGDEADKPDEYRILLAWGGPAVQITGDLSEYGEPETAIIQYQDWFTGWATLDTTDDEDEVMLRYAQYFYSGV